KDIWGVPEQWEEPFPGPIPRSYVRLATLQRWTLVYFRGTVLRWFPLREEFFHWCESVHFVAMEKGKKGDPKRARSMLLNLSRSGDHLRRTLDLGRASLPQEFVARSRSEGTVLSSGEVQFREELEASRAEVVASDPRLWPTIFKATRNSAKWSLSVSTIPKADTSELYRIWPPFILKSTFRLSTELLEPLVAILDAQKIIFHFSPLIEFSEGFSYVVTLGVSQRGRPFYGDQAKGILAPVLKEMHYKRY
ncbi:hypothetical protein ACLOJK_007043, partial [Asimina triloba]